MHKPIPKHLTLLVMTWKRIGGLEAAVHDIGDAFVTLGWRVRVVAVFDPRDSRQERDFTVTSLMPHGQLICSLWCRGLWKVVAAYQVLRDLYNNKGLLVVGHAHLLPVLDWMPRLAGVQWLAWIYGREMWGSQARRWVPRLNKLDYVVSISSFTASEIMRHGYRRALSLIPCCVDPNLFCPTPTPARIRRREILICGRMSALKRERYKGHEVLFRSVPLAEKLMGHKLSVRVVGSGDDVERLRQLAYQLKIDVRFAGRLPERDLVEAYQHCGVFCMPSRVDRHEEGFWTGEGFGIVYIEAAACGRPVIASSDGGAPETIIPGQTGLLVDPRSPEDVARAIADIIGDDRRADEMGHQGRILVQNKYSREIFKQRIQRLAASLAASSTVRCQNEKSYCNRRLD